MIRCLVGALVLVPWLAPRCGAADYTDAEGGVANIPYSSVVRDPGAPYEDYIGKIELGVRDPSIKFGPGGTGGASGLNLGVTPTLGIPFIERGFAPGDATMKVGPLYTLMRRTYAEVLFSDNANLDQRDREGGVIGIVGQELSLALQLTEGLRLGASGQIIWLPFEGDIGLAGFGMNDRFVASLDASGIFDRLNLWAQYDWLLGGWDMMVRDTLQSFYDDGLTGNLGTFETLNAISDRDFDKVDELGRFSFGNRTYSDYDDDTYGKRGDRNIEDYLKNSAVFAMTRVLPTETRATFSLWRNDYYYFEDEERDHRIEWEEGATAALVSERWNLRFKPYGSYTISTDSEQDYWDQVGRVGFYGPITDYTHINANYGYWHSPRGSGRETEHLWEITLRNEPRDSISQWITYRRMVTNPAHELRTTLGYGMNWVIGPYLRSSVFADWSSFEEGDPEYPGADGRNEYRAGIQLDYDYSPRVDFRFTNAHTTVQEESDNGTDYDKFTSRSEAIIKLTPTARLSLMYQWERRDSTGPGDSYYENLFRVRLTKDW